MKKTIEAILMISLITAIITGISFLSSIGWHYGEICTLRFTAEEPSAGPEDFLIEQQRQELNKASGK